MSSTTFIGRKVRSFDCAPKFDGYSKVVITVSEEVEYTAGTDTGRTLTLTCPWGTQAMADDLLADIQGFAYQPYEAADALLDPAAELGDGVTISGTYGGIYSMETKFGALCTASISAPFEEEIDHEYPYVPKQERQVTRKLNNISSELKIQADLISAKVSKEGGDASSFGWILDEKSWTIQANSKDILKATKDGLEVYGIITATGGKIGGFTINSNSLTYGGQTWRGDVSNGIYIGPSGIQLGKNFRVDSGGNLYAASGEFSGNIAAKNINYGGDFGYFNGGGISSGSIAKGAMVKTVQNSIDLPGQVFNENKKVRYINTGALMVDGTQFTKQTIAFKDGNGLTRSFTVLAEASE